MIKIKIYKKLLTITLAITSIASIGLISPASASYTSFLRLTNKACQKIYNVLLNSHNNSSKNNLLNTLNSFKNDINFNDIKASSEFSKKLNDYLKDKKIGSRNAIITFVNKSIIPAFSNPGKFDKDVAINFLMDYISIKPSLIENSFVSALQYNHIMDAQFQKAIAEYKNENPSFDENDGDTLNNLNVTIKSPNGQSINLNQLNLTKNNMKHILVGSVAGNSFKNKQLPVGHTKYAKEGMAILSNIRYNQLKKAMNGSNSFVNLFTRAVGFSPDAYVSHLEDHNDDQYYSIQYYPLNDSNYTYKGMFPDSWEWKDIRADIKNTIATNNCVYATVENDKNIAYFYALTRDKSVLAIVNLTDQNLITTIPMSLKDLKENVSNNFKGLLSDKAIRSVSGLRISKENLTKLVDENLVKKAENPDSNLNWQNDGDFINISRKI